MKQPTKEEISSHAYFKYMKGSEECNQGIRNRMEGFKDGAEWIEQQLKSIITELQMENRKLKKDLMKIHTICKIDSNSDSRELDIIYAKHLDMIEEISLNIWSSTED